MHSLRAISCLLLAAFSANAVAQEHLPQPIIQLTMHEGAGESFHSHGSVSVAAVRVGSGGEWTQSVPSEFLAGSAWSLRGQSGSAIIISGEKLPELATLEDFTFTGWVQLREPRHLSRIISKSLPRMSAFFELRIENESETEPRFTAALRTGSIAPNGYAERGYEVHSEPFSPQGAWMALALVRESSSGLVTFYLAPHPDAPYQPIGVGTGPIGPIETDRADLVIGNTRLNMARTLDADLSDFRIYPVAMSESELEGIRQSALQKTP